MVDGDEARLTQVVTNLLINSVRYTEPGGAITVAAWRDGERPSCRSATTVRGSTPRGFRTSSIRSEGAPSGRLGLGLGLTIVHNLVELHGGTATAHSDGPGRGATFEVRLRTFAAPVARAEPAVRTPAPAVQRRKILIVDDNREAANLMGEALRLSGHEVALAYQADEALLRVERFTPDVALLDVGLAGMSGHDLGEELRQRHAAMKLVAITGYGQPSDREASRRAGFAAHLVKPVGLSELLEVIGG